MARACTGCSHPDRDSIDAELVCGTPLSEIARRFHVGANSLRRHRDRHLSEAIVGMITQEQTDRRTSLLDRIEKLIERAEAMFNEAAASGKFDQSLNALKELRLQLELLGKATGELDTRPQVTLNLQASPEWIAVRAAVFAALADYPDARAQVSSRLLQLEAGES